MITVREATASDADFVASIMTEALSPYYGGDHVAHSERILRAHLESGADKLGFFSTEQKMFIVEKSGKPVGMLHLVGKRQGTYKISPLILSSASRGYGIGPKLLAHAINYAEAHDARQLYCTVAVENKRAFQFFSQNGFICSGLSSDHYKSGVTEAMMYLPLNQSGLDQVFDTPHVSVLPMEERHKSLVKQLLLLKLRDHFLGIDEHWVSALFGGYDRRFSGDINQKFKLVYVAEDRNGNLLGVAGATPKKGEPIKLMPLVSADDVGFFALLSDVPGLVKSDIEKFLRSQQETPSRRDGAKLYVHIVPSAPQTVFLQKQGWRCDAMMPGGYEPKIVTQQWSLDLTDNGIDATIRLKQPFLDAIRDGRKTLEVRVAYNNMKRLEPGNVVKFMSRSDEVLAEITGKRTYRTFEEMLQSEDYRRIVPEESKPGTLKLLQQIYPASKEKLGVVVFEVKFIE